MKKTLIITLEFPPDVGGIATYVRDIAAAIGDSACVLAPETAMPEESRSGDGYRVIRKKLFFPSFAWPRWIPLIVAAIATARREKIELALIHHALPAGYAGIFLKKFLGVPFVLFSHGTDFVAGTRTAWKKKMFSRVAAAAEAVVFNSQSLRRRFLLAFPSFENKAIVSYPCPSPEFYTAPPAQDVEALRDRYGLRGKKVLLSVARITDGKGFPHLARMLPKILEREPNLVWIVAGGGDKQAEFLETVQKLHLQNVVRYAGEVPHEALRVFYYAADVFVLLTHPDEGREEGLGLVFLEAASAGLPIVAGRSGGVQEAVAHQETGYVLDVHQNEKGIIDAIVELLHNPAKAREIGVRGQERIRREFQWEEQMRKLSQWL